MEGLIHQIFSGLANGCIYGSIALALVMIYQATHHLNFAQGEMATFSTFIAWALIQRGLPYWLALLLIFNALSGWIFDHTVKAFPSPFPQESALKTAYFSAHESGSFLVMLAVL